MDREHGASWGYGNAPAALEEFYARFEGYARRFCAIRHVRLLLHPTHRLFQEQNGIYTFDRRPSSTCSACAPSSKLWQRLKQQTVTSKRPAGGVHPPLRGHNAIGGLVKQQIVRSH